MFWNKQKTYVVEAYEQTITSKCVVRNFMVKSTKKDLTKNIDDLLESYAKIMTVDFIGYNVKEIKYMKAFNGSDAKTIKFP